jgi:hypothetical protein
MMKRILGYILLKLFVFDSDTAKAVAFKKPNRITIIPFFVLGIFSLIWFLIRVIPKPGRIVYPCMKVAVPLAFSFIAILGTMVVSVLFFKKAILYFRASRLRYALILCLSGIMFGVVTMLIHPVTSSAAGNIDNAGLFSDPLGPNVPIGTPKGIFPGRVVWEYDPNATNEKCTNSNHADAYWLDKNCNQTVVDKMFSDGIRSLTGKSSDAEAWDAIFRYFNINHGKGDTGYIAGETVFIKINAVTAWGGAAPKGVMPSNLAIEYDTSPQTILAMLRQLVNVAKVPQEDIYIGDPIADIWNTLYDVFYTEFPDIKYVSKRNIPGRYKLTANTEPGIHYSDKGTVMNEVTSHCFFKEMTDADYLLNIPTMKGHRWGGTTLFAKNHFGSNTTDGSWQLHKGLMKPSDQEPLRPEYKSYRVLVDLMASQYLGGKTLLYFMDALWSTSYEHQRPQKFQSAPFNNDWSSSLIFSLDPVAVESVCLDILQKEFTQVVYLDGTDGPATDRFTFVQWDGVDDYLHQAASQEWWPEGITYDPDSTGTPVGSLGVHEHWNNSNDMEYSRNLGTGEGIELIKHFSVSTDIKETPTDVTIEVVPNPVVTLADIRFHLSVRDMVQLDVFTPDGRHIHCLVNGPLSAGDHCITWYPGNFKGIYLIRLYIKGDATPKTYIRKVEVL